MKFQPTKPSENHFAHRADPTAKLYYNEHGAQGSGGKSDADYNLAKRRLNSGVLLDGIGWQCHLTSGGFKAGDISANIRRRGALGLRVSMTEVDIENGTRADWTNLLGACLEDCNGTAFVTRGLYDGASWAPVFSARTGAVDLPGRTQVGAPV